MPQLPAPPNRRDRQRQTREAIIFAAREAFAEQGYHGARLDAIAQAAGFSKGAVYSNFASKADLFLAVMDKNIEDTAAQEDWDPFSPQHGQASQMPGVDQAIKGFALATLEFIAVAARDEGLSAQASKRVEWLTDAYSAVVEAFRAGQPDSLVKADGLTAAQLGALMAALDQGVALLSLAGSDLMDQRLLHTGLLRLLAPSQAAPPGPSAVDGAPGLDHSVLRERMAQALAADYAQEQETGSPPPGAASPTR